MKTKILLWSVVSLLATGATADALESGSDTDPAQVIALKDGAKLKLLGVTYGRHHVAPGYETLATGNWIDTSTNDTVVWIEVEHDSGQWPSFQLLVSDIANTGCVASEVKARSHVKSGVEIQGFVLRAFPRWDKAMILRVAPYGGEVPKEHFLIANPQPGFFVNLKPDPLPNTRSDGDFQVTLTKLVGGAPSFSSSVSGVPKDDLLNKSVRIAFDFKQNGKAVTNWTPGLVETSDAAGNHVRSRIDYRDPEVERHFRDHFGHPIHSESTDDYKGYFYQPGLWPDEPAWKVRLEFVRTSGFENDEILTLTNVPVKAGTPKDWDDEWTWESGQGSFTPVDYTVNGIDLKLLPPLLHPDKFQPDQMRLSVIMRANPNPQSEGMRITLLKATDDQGRQLWSPFNPTAGYNSTFEFVNPPPNLKALNLQFALHKSRFVEFTVKP